jgi:AcrR family transcriptional regulator
MVRRYSSPLREEQAAQTRRRILAFAAELFARNGYAGTSLAQIASAAGTSPETVKANGPKSALLVGAFDQAFTGAEEFVPIHERDLGRQLAAAPEEELLTRYVEFVASANERIAGLWAAFVAAAPGDAEVGRELEALQRRRREDFRASIALFRERGLARREAPDEELAAALSFLVSPEGYVQLVTEQGWEPGRYRSWLVETVERAVLAE